MKYVTRIAPSPTGPVHLGTVRTAYFNWLAARASGGKFIVRIDDTDLERSDSKWAEQFFNTLSWLGLDWDETYTQSDRKEVYDTCAGSLVDMGLAKRDGLRVHLNLKSIPHIPYWTDEVGGDIKIQLDNLVGFDQMTLIKSDGSPTYHFASCVDDIELGINYIIRGVDHITNTSKHVMLFHLLGGTLPKFAHIGLLRLNKRKLSKRDPESDFKSYIEHGYDPDAMLNFLGKCCWGPTNDDKSKKFLPKSKMVELFLTEGKMKSKDVEIDLRLLDSFDRKYKARKQNGEVI